MPISRKRVYPIASLTFEGSWIMLLSVIRLIPKTRCSSLGNSKRSAAFWGSDLYEPTPFSRILISHAPNPEVPP